jgi:hypothetical protein
MVECEGFKLALFTILFPYVTLVLFKSFRLYQHADCFVCPTCVSLQEKRNTAWAGKANMFVRKFYLPLDRDSDFHRINRFS